MESSCSGSAPRQPHLTSHLTSPCLFPPHLLPLILLFANLLSFVSTLVRSWALLQPSPSSPLLRIARKTQSNSRCSCCSPPRKHITISVNLRLILSRLFDPLYNRFRRQSPHFTTHARFVQSLLHSCYDSTDTHYPVPSSRRLYFGARLSVARPLARAHPRQSSRLLACDPTLHRSDRRGS